MNDKKLGKGLGKLLENINEAYEAQIEKKTIPITREQKEIINSISDNNIKKFILEISKNDCKNMEICLTMYEFLKEYFISPPKQKNHKKAYVLKVFKNIINENRSLTTKEHIQKTADFLNITPSAVKNHIYRKNHIYKKK